MILLPGIGDRANTFEKNGIIENILASNTGYDIISVEAHFKYYQNRTLVERLHEDIVQPALKKGYKEIVFGGVSLGGLGALLYLKYHPENVTKVVLIAPYLGEKQEYDYLIDKSKPKPNEFKIGLWPWLSQLPEKQTRKIFLAYGKQDKFSEPNALLESYLPENNTYTTDGKHLWSTWRGLWPSIFSEMTSGN